MNLKKFREQLMITQIEAAQRLGVSEDVYRSWEYKKRIPRSESMEAIISWSNGEVQPNDFYLSENEREE